MASTGVDAFDTTMNKTNIWLKEIGDEMGWDDRHLAYLALRGVLVAIRDRLTVDEAAQFGAQLPLLIRGMYYDGWRPSAMPVKYDLEGFLFRIKEQFVRAADVNPEQVARAVFRVISRRTAQGEIEDVEGIMPADIREFLTQAAGEIRKPRS